MSVLTQEKLKELICYDPVNGTFTWSVRMARRCAYKGDPAGTITRGGYRAIGVLGTVYLAHRLAWLYMEGFLPVDIDIDHIDRNPLNNRFDNLRLVSRQCNMRNQRMNIRNKTGVTGVCWDKRREKWEVCIMSNFNTKHIGRYENFDDAVCARLAAEQCLGWGSCDSNSSAYKYVSDNILNNKIRQTIQ